jgi:NAD(P)-dependent dehydrogenase (short-subunit alcohol dehydrogenase family)
MSELAGKVILVTGASKGIGTSIAKTLGERGAHVIAHYGSDEEGAKAAVAGIPEERRFLLQADLSDLSSTERLWGEAEAWKGRIDVFVNNAAIMLFGEGVEGPVEEWDEIWEKTLQVNVLAPGRLIRLATRSFLAQGGGAIVTISSWAAQRGVTNPGTIAYGASKAAVRNMTQTIARAYADKGILAYVIAPGVVRTRLSLDFAETQGGEEAVSQSLAMKEWVDPIDIAETVAFLSTSRARHLTGATIDINGASYVR